MQTFVMQVAVNRYTYIHTYIPIHGVPKYCKFEKDCVSLIFAYFLV